jgi:DNA polymerase
LSDRSIEVWNSRYHRWDYTWGGAITENIVQALCRDILCGAILDMEENGLRVPYHCHDETVTIAHKDVAEAKLAAALRIMCKVPTWAPGFPIAAEGQIQERYTK